MDVVETTILSAAILKKGCLPPPPAPPFETFVDFVENPRGTPFSTWRVSAEVTTKLGISLS